MKRIRFLPQAEAEIDEIVDYYEKQLAGLGRKFFEEFKKASARLQKYPLVAPVLDDPVRRAILKSFPYSIFYVLHDKFILIVSVAHHKRKPEYWKDRLRES